MVADPAALLREHGIQVTAQRLAVLRAVSAAPHTTADAVAAVVRAEIGTISLQSVYDALNALVTAGQAKLVAVTLGQDGSILAGDRGAFYLPAVEVEVRSAVGAGDSFLAGMAFGLAAGNDEMTAFRMGVAAGAAAVQSPGTDLCKTADVDRLLERVGTPQPITIA